MNPRVTVVIPTLAADAALLDCLSALQRQTLRDFEVIVVDNSGQKKARQNGAAEHGACLIENERNLGFGAAVNQGFERSHAPYLAVLNDDAMPHPEWLSALVSAIERRDDAGMCASRIRLAGTGLLDSAGMRIAGDGSSKQRGNGESPEAYEKASEVLCPSACAALYRRSMLDEIGFFDESFFLYCEDTDLGLRGRWAGWDCLYVPGAVVDHRYSHSAGAASPLKAYYVERNRLYLILKNYPLGSLLLAPFYAAARYLWHILYIVQGRGAAAEFRKGGHSGLRLIGYVVRAHCSALLATPRLWRSRRAIRKRARLTSAQFGRLLRSHSLTAREVAAQ